MNPQIPNFSGDISIDKNILKEHSCDRSIFSVVPSAVIYPKNSKDISQVLKFAKENSKTISVRAGGTCMSGGSLDDGWILNLTKYMNNVEVDPKTQTATVEAGAYFRDIEDEATKHGLMFAPYPSSHRICGIGGMIGNNASGEQSVRHGATIDNIISLDVVLSDGITINTGPKNLDKLNNREKELFSLFLKNANDLIASQGKVSKVASGYRLDRIVKNGKVDLTPLFVGAQGTLGIVTKAVLKLIPIPKHHRLVLACVKSLEDLPELLDIARQHNPECIETFDINTFHAAKINMQKEVEHASTYIHDDSKLSVLIQFSEDTGEKTEEVMKKFITSASHLSMFDIHIADDRMRETLWSLRRGAYTEIQNLNKGGYRAVPCIEDIIVPVENIAKLITELNLILEKEKVAYGFHGHIGEGSLRIIPFFDLSSPEAPHQMIALMRKVFSLVKSCGGNMCADHSDGIIRSPFLKEFYGEKLFGVFTEIKKIFDPKNILNPKKKIGGLEENIAKYIKSSI